MTNFKEILTIKFNDVEPSDDTEYCKQWFINYGLQQGMVIGSSMTIVLINIITGMVFEKIVVFEKRHTLNEETIGLFMKIFILQYVNIAVVILIVNFDELVDSLVGYFQPWNQLFYQVLGLFSDLDRVIFSLSFLGVALADLVDVVDRVDYLTDFLGIFVFPFDFVGKILL